MRPRTLDSRHKVPLSSEQSLDARRYSCASSQHPPTSPRDVVALVMVSLSVTGALCVRAGASASSFGVSKKLHIYLGIMRLTSVPHLS
jgi:hypothetical protein